MKTICIQYRSTFPYFDKFNLQKIKEKYTVQILLKNI